MFVLFVFWDICAIKIVNIMKETILKVCWLINIIIDTIFGIDRRLSLGIETRSTRVGLSSHIISNHRNTLQTLTCRCIYDWLTTNISFVRLNPLTRYSSPYY